MRIAYILNTLQTGGAERQVVALAERMFRRGHTVRILALRPGCAGQIRTDLDVVHLNMRRSPLCAVAGFMCAIHGLREFRPDVIHGNQFHGNMLARLLHLAMPDVAVISTIHNVYEGGVVRRILYRLTDRYSARTVAVCSAAHQRFTGSRGCPQSKSHVITNGIDLARFAPDASRRARLRAELTAGRSFVWLAVCRLTPAKDLPTLLHAFAMTCKGAAIAQLWIAGEGEPLYVEALRQLSNELGLHAVVRWLGPREDVAALLDAADAFVLSSLWEGLPLALGEAMAMEKPFVATDVGGVGELAGECGVLVPSGDAQALARAMRKTMRMNATDRGTAGYLARTRIEKYFDLNAKTLEWERCYLHVAEGG